MIDLYPIKYYTHFIYLIEKIWFILYNLSSLHLQTLDVVLKNKGNSYLMIMYSKSYDIAARKCSAWTLLFQPLLQPTPSAPPVGVPWAHPAHLDWANAGSYLACVSWSVWGVVASLTRLRRQLCVPDKQDKAGLRMRLYFMGGPYWLPHIRHISCWTPLPFGLSPTTWSRWLPSRRTPSYYLAMRRRY